MGVVNVHMNARAPFHLLLFVANVGTLAVRFSLRSEAGWNNTSFSISRLVRLMFSVACTMCICAKAPFFGLSEGRGGSSSLSSSLRMHSSKRVTVQAVNFLLLLFCLIANVCIFPSISFHSFSWPISPLCDVDNCKFWSHRCSQMLDAPYIKAQLNPYLLPNGETGWPYHLVERKWSDRAVFVSNLNLPYLEL